MRQRGEAAEHVEVGQLRQAVAGQHEVAQVGDGVGQRGLEGRDPVAREQQGAQAGRQREVGHELDVVVGEVYGIVGLCHGNNDGDDGNGQQEYRGGRG